MNITVNLTCKNSSFHAEGIFSDAKHFIVLKGSIINIKATKGLVARKAIEYRDNREFVDETGLVINDCFFSSPSTAAQFVNGSSTNGYVAWKVGKKTLKNYLEELERGE